MTGLFITRAADISACGRYRYSLSRVWAPAFIPPLPIIMLNPSTADAAIDDPTIKRCMAFAGREGFGGCRVFNLFAFRATKPADMRAADDPVGPQNDETLRAMLAEAAGLKLPVLAAWGAHGGHLGRDAIVMDMAFAAGVRVVSLGRTVQRHPRHPLYVKGDQPFEEFR